LSWSEGNWIGKSWNWEIGKLYSHLVDMTEKPTIIAAGGLVLNEAGELLMIFRRGKWDLPKGKLDKGESIEHCALREVMEETGLERVALAGLISIGHHEYFDQYVNADVIKETHWFLMKAPGDQQLVPQTSEDILEIKWVEKNALKTYLENTYPNIIDVIDKAGLR
jgi:8-oxo-dGTP pyrophosphatase MutT (NUDIX family)